MRVAASPGAAPDATPQEILRLEDVSMRFGDVVALDGVGLSVHSGTILGIIGPSGAGKTTMIRILTGALQPTRGKVSVLGQEPRRFSRRAREQIGYMPQLFTLYPDLTASENVDFVASLFGLLWFRRRKRVQDVLKVVDLWDARNRRASNLSGGMQRRLELACALVHDPSLYFLDEPTAGIDPLLRSRIWEELHRLKDARRTLLVTTQYVNEAEECDVVALVAEGRLIALATPEDLRRQATGGDVIEVETTEPFDDAPLRSVPAVRQVSRIGDTTLRVLVDDAGEATPDVVEAVRAAGGEVAAAREYRASFDEVFAQLVAASREQRQAVDLAETEMTPVGTSPPSERPATVNVPPDGTDAEATEPAPPSELVGAGQPTEEPRQ
jgi:ABC-2 type transport system ATP-binding protein